MPRPDTLVAFVPRADTDAVLAAVFAAGAGRLGDYECCAWTTDGVGQFRPLPGADPTIGSAGEMEHVPETRCEVPFDPALREQVIAALTEAHPYEEPSYYVISG